MVEKLHLQWDDFKDNVNSAFGNLRKDKNFTDVTLACEDGQQMAAHKVILAASSPFFEKILRENKNPHPLIYMRGVKLDELSSIVDFLYFGEATVCQENVDSFLAIAEELQLKGLLRKSNSSKKNDLDYDLKLPPPWKSEPDLAEITKDRATRLKQIQGLMGKSHSRDGDEDAALRSHPLLKSELDSAETTTDLAKYLKPIQSAQIVNADQEGVTLPDYFSGGFEDLEQSVVSMMEKSPNLCSRGKQKTYTCKVCGKEAKGRDIKDHIEAKHLNGIAIPCNLCKKIFRSRPFLS